VTRNLQRTAAYSPVVVLGQLVVTLIGMAVLSFLVVGLLLWWGYWRAVDLDRDDRASAQNRPARCLCDNDGRIPGLSETREEPRAARRDVRTPSPSPSSDAGQDGSSGSDTGSDPVTLPRDYAEPEGNGQTQGYLQNLLFFLAAIPLGVAIWALRRLAKTLPVWARAVRAAEAEGPEQSAAPSRRRRRSGNRRRSG
jgi:hypothetical protein